MENQKVKYAIYRGKIGLYALEYFDKWNEEIFKDRGVMGYQHIKEEDLPIVVNQSGGRHSFNPVDDTFVEIREVDEDAEPLTREDCFPKNAAEFQYGWLDPEGNTYNTGVQGHCRAADMLFREVYGEENYNAERALEKLGWIKITKDLIYSEERVITEQQIDTLLRLGYQDEPTVKRLIQNSQQSL